MNVLSKVLVLLKLKKINRKNISDWIQESNIEMLLFSLDHCAYDDRLHIVKMFRNVGSTEVIQKLLYIARTEMDDMSKMSIDTIKYLDKLGLYESKLERIIDNKNIYLSMKFKSDAMITYKRDRMQMLEHVKRQLKKRMR